MSYTDVSYGRSIEGRPLKDLFLDLIALAVVE